MRSENNYIVDDSAFFIGEDVQDILQYLRHPETPPWYPSCKILTLGSP